MDSKGSPHARQTAFCTTEDNTSGRTSRSTIGSELLPSSTAFRLTSNAIRCRPSLFPNLKHGPGPVRLESPPTPFPYASTDAFVAWPILAVLSPTKVAYNRRV